ncbi:hypothetical protein LRP30_30875 [Bradyrhizobium sp. C-145]|uniref:hypothetical protein n=1 Tax=Bradyrhizobium sp. C-145 TaxID=574727 RepID=UPI00201B4748|nr:hypothetical protein [Bradyrhizobium sp. C-145]UQR61325.1 hypothetical protein LRP30_30875 [Bradyrhizobium sp. C-145]
MKNFTVNARIIASIWIQEDRRQNAGGADLAAGSDAGLRKERDPTLVHHIYDLHETGWHYDTAKVAALTHDVIEADAQSRDMRNPSAKWFMMTSRIATQRWDR